MVNKVVEVGSGHARANQSQPAPPSGLLMGGMEDFSVRERIPPTGAVVADQDARSSGCTQRQPSSRSQLAT